MTYRNRTGVKAVALSGAIALGAFAALALAVFGPAITGRAVADPVLRWMLSAAAVALAALALGLWRGTPAFGAMAALVLAGGAAQLALTAPNLFPAPRIKPDGPVDFAMLGLIGAEAVAAVLVLVRAGLRGLLRRGHEYLGLWRVAAVVIVTGVLTVSIMRYAAHDDWRGFGLRLASGGVLTTVHLAALTALGCLRSPFAALTLPRWFAPVLAVAASLMLGWAAFQHLPHVEDEYAYLFQAQTFAGGALTAPAPPEATRTGLEYYLLTIVENRWYAVTAPGWPLALALGVALGVPWLINPLLLGLGVWFAQGIARARAGDRVATVTGLLMATSPWLLAAGASYMTHALTIALILFAWWMLTRSEDLRPARAVPALLAGLAMGWVFAARPLDGLVVGTLTGIWVLFGPGRSVTRAAAYSIGAAATGSLYLLYNRALTGSALHDPLGRYLTAEWKAYANDFGFGPNIGPPGGWGALDLQPGHSPAEGMINTANNLSSLQFEMFGWAAGSLLFLMAAVFWLRHRAFDRAMWVVCIATVATLFFYWFAGSFYFGPRYWLIAAMPAIYLSARGFLAVEDRLGAGEGRLTGVLVVLSASALLVFTPWRGVTKYYQYGNFYDTVRSAAATGQFGTAVVVIPKNGNPASSLMLNDPWLRADRPVFLIDWGTLDLDAVRAAFPGRAIMRFTPVWKADPPPPAP